MQVTFPHLLVLTACLVSGVRTMPRYLDGWMVGGVALRGGDSIERNASATRLDPTRPVVHRLLHRANMVNHTDRCSEHNHRFLICPIFPRCTLHPHCSQRCSFNITSSSWSWTHVGSAPQLLRKQIQSLAKPKATCNWAAGMKRIPVTSTSQHIITHRTCAPPDLRLLL